MPIDNSTRFPKPLAADLRELSEGMAIVIDGDTAPKAIASGQYLFIKNHSTLATGGYHATAAIASGADITSSNVTPDADGIVNGAFSSLSEQIANSRATITGENSWSWNAKIQKIGRIAIYFGNTISNNNAMAVNKWTTIGTLPQGFKPVNRLRGCAYDDTNDSIIEFDIQTNGTINVFSKTPAKSIAMNFVYITA